MVSNADPTALESLIGYAQRFAQFPQNENARSNLIIRLVVATDVDLLQALAGRFPLNPEIVIPTWHRITALKPDDPSILLRAAQVYYSNGFDNEAITYIDKLLDRDSACIPALELKASLARDVPTKKKLYQQILDIEPTNRAAFHHLIMFRDLQNDDDHD